MSDLAEEREVILGVDTHLDVHVAVLIDVVGRVVARTSVPTTALGYEQLIEWVRGFGRFTRAGIEGTGTYGAALARRVQEHGVQVLEINRPDRSRRRLRGKNDPTDAENAARAVLAGEANAIPKAQSGVVGSNAGREYGQAQRGEGKDPSYQSIASAVGDGARIDTRHALEGETRTMRGPLRSAAIAGRYTAAQGANQYAAPACKTLDEPGERAPSA